MAKYSLLPQNFHHRVNAIVVILLSLLGNLVLTG